jgi:hypothetical protein
MYFILFYFFCIIYLYIFIIFILLNYSDIFLLFHSIYLLLFFVVFTVESTSETIGLVSYILLNYSISYI